MAAAAQPPVSAQVVGNAFVNQYYQILHHSPELVHRFYQEISKLGRPDDDGPLSLTTTMQAINEKILSLNYGEFKAEIKSVDSQESYDGGVHVLVTGCLEGKDNLIQNFTQTFFLAPQDKGYFVLNDMFQYVGGKYKNENPGPINDVEAPLSPKQEHSPVQENHVVDQTISTIVAKEEVEEVETTDVEQVPVVEEEVPVLEVVDDVPDKAQVEEAESNSKTENTPKKSYASIVMVMKENPNPISSPVPRKPAAKSLKQVSLTQASVPATETSVGRFEVTENGNHQEGEAEGYSVYIKGLPLNAIPAQLEDEFKKFGPIKYDGIQVRSNKQGFCFGFVEFEEANAVEKAIEASPVMIGGRQAYVEEKKSTSTKAIYRGRYSGGRGPVFRNEGTRGGRGNFGNGRGYNNNRSEFNGRSEFGNNRGNSRGGDGYQSIGGGGRENRGGAMVTKTGPPRVSITA